MNVFNKRRWERKHTRSLSAHMQNRSDQSSQPTHPATERFCTRFTAPSLALRSSSVFLFFSLALAVRSQARQGPFFSPIGFLGALLLSLSASCSQTLALSRARSITPKLIGRISGHDPSMHLVLSDPSIRRKRHKSAMSSVMKMNDRLGMSKAADVDILLPSDRNLPPGKNTQLRRGRKATVAPDPKASAPWLSSWGNCSSCTVTNFGCGPEATWRRNPSLPSTLVRVSH